MEVHKVIIFTLIYLVIGYGVYYYALRRYDDMFKRKLQEKYKDNPSIVEEYRNLWQIKKFPDKLGCLGVVLFGWIAVIAVWTLWPLWTLVTLIFCPAKYRCLCKKYGETS